MVSKGEMWVLTRTASRSHIVKSGQAHIGLITASRSRTPEMQPSNRQVSLSEEYSMINFALTEESINRRKQNISCFANFRTE